MWLNWSWPLALVSLVVLAAAVGIVWLKTPDDTTAPSKTIVFTNDGVAACGKLQPATDKNTIVVFDKDKKAATPINAGDVTALGTLMTCPGE
jgi:hypothetical protein